MTAGSAVGCFGKVAYDEVPAAGTGASIGSGGALLGVPALPGTGASGSSGGSSSREPIERPPDPPPACVVDCCPSGLTRVALSPDGAPLDADVERAHLSADGTWIALSTRATNLLAAIASGRREVFLHSLISGRTLVVRPIGQAAPTGDADINALSADGRWLLLTSSADNWAAYDQNDAADVFLFDRVSGALELVSRASTGVSGNGSSLGRDLSPDGRFVVYSSAASNLVDGDDNSGWDVFVWDRQTGATRRVSMGPGDQQSNPVPGNHAHVSADGRYVSFHSASDLLVPGDATGTFDVFLADLELGTTSKVSRSSTGGEADGNTFVLGMSDDGRFLSSYGSATNLIGFDTNGQSDVFFFDRVLGTAKRVNVGPAGQEAESGTTSVSLSHDGRLLGFASASVELSEGLSGVSLQSYVHTAETGQLIRVSENRRGEPGNVSSYAPELSGSGRCFVLTSYATNLTPESVDDGVADLFLGALP